MSSHWASLILQNPKILIVDDEKDLAEVTADILRSGGAEVQISMDGHSGLVAANLFNPDLVILDLSMPVMTGAEVMDELHNRGFEKPIVMLTGTAQITNVVDAIRKRAFDFISKPFKKDTLVHVVQRALSFEQRRLLLEEEIERVYLELFKGIPLDKTAQLRVNVREAARESLNRKRAKAA